MEPTDLNLIPATALCYSTRSMLSVLLNPEQKLLSKDGYSRDYHGLAEQMNFSYTVIRNFERSENVTLKILDAWSLQQDSSIGKLVNFLENMGRHDVIEDTKELFDRDVRKYLREQQVFNPVQVPEVTSCRSQLSSFNDMNILTRDDACTGEVTFYDAYISYADEDLEFVFNLAKNLEDEGFKLFIRSRDLLAGFSEYETNIQIIKDRCKRVLIVLSPAFLNCPACEVQAGFAASLGFDERQRKIIPILWKSCEIPPIIKYISRIDFTRPGVKDWILDILKGSLRDVTPSTFISPEKISPGIDTLLQIEPDTSKPVITFPPTGPFGQNSIVYTGACTSSVNVNEELFKDSLTIAATTSLSTAATASLSTTRKTSLTKSKNKLTTLFWPSKKVSKKKSAYSSTSESSSSNATSGFHSQSGNSLESIDTTNDTSAQNTSG